MSKFKVGDMVISSLCCDFRKEFIIKEIGNCRTRRQCLIDYGKDYACPGYVNGRCYGVGNVYHLKKIGISNPNNDIIIKQV